MAGEPAESPVSDVPHAAFAGLETLWIQVTGTLCNLRCTHCFISCSPDNHTLEFMSRDQIGGYLTEAEELGVKEVYFTGGEPFLHPEIFEILEDALSVAPTAVLTNGVLITERAASRLGAMAADSAYSLEIRVSLDVPDETANDAIRGAGVFRKALRGVRRLQDAGLMPIVTACELVVEEERGSATWSTEPGRERTGDGGSSSVESPPPTGVDPRLVPARPAEDRFYRQFHELLEAEGVARPRLKILPVFNMGMLEGRGDAVLLTEEMLADFDTDNLQCSASRLVAHDGVYACPILAGEPGARMSDDSLAAASRPCALYHPSCTTCYLTGMTCRNY